jgi:hypothetical protein
VPSFHARISVLSDVRGKKNRLEDFLTLQREKTTVTINGVATPVEFGSLFRGTPNDGYGYIPVWTAKSTRVVVALDGVELGTIEIVRP